MSNETDAAKLLVMVAKYIAPVLALAPELERVGSLRNVEAAFKDRVAALQVEEQRWLGLIEGHRETEQRSRLEAEQNRAGLKAELDKLKTEAADHVKRQQAAAEKIASDAKIAAEAIITAAQREATGVEEEARANVARIGVEIANSQGRLAAINAQITTRETALADLKKKLAPALGG